jgi:hypothetical protein
VDEYNGDTNTGRQTSTFTKPLSLGELINFFLQGWDLLGCLDHNFWEDGYPRDEVREPYDGYLRSALHQLARRAWAKPLGPCASPWAAALYTSPG